MSIKSIVREHEEKQRVLAHAKANKAIKCIGIVLLAVAIVFGIVHIVTKPDNSGLYKKVKNDITFF